MSTHRKTWTHGLLGFTLVGIGLGLMSCREDEEACENFCAQAADCAELGGLPFSARECERDCADDEERYASVDCDDPYYEVLDCQSGLSCGNWGEVSDRCDYAIEYLDACLR